MKENIEEIYWMGGAIDVEGMFTINLKVYLMHIGILMMLKNLMNQGLKLKYYL